MILRVSHVNGPRLADEIVVYENIPSTGTNPYGMEAVVEDGVVVRVGSNDNAVPANGYVISGHGKGAEAVRSLCAGAKAAFDREAGEIDIIIDDSSRIYGAKQKLEVVKQRFEKLVMSNQSFYIDRAVSEIERASAAIEKGDVKRPKKRIISPPRPKKTRYAPSGTAPKKRARNRWKPPSDGSKTRASI